MSLPLGRLAFVAASFLLAACQTTPKSLASPPVPANDPAKWITANDYPADLHAGEGVTKVDLVIGRNGRVKACALVESSGFPNLDKAACKWLLRRARFVPAKNDVGVPVSGTYSVTTKWKLER